MSPPAPLLVVATGNAKKAVELRELLGDSVRVETLADHPELEMPPEIGETFEENARAKAEHVAAILGVAVLADDSGLEVDALDGAPGVRSARYGPGTDTDRTAKLLGALAGVPEAARGARFVCAIALAGPGAETVVVRGECPGRIAAAPAGGGGFGYDPVFLVAGGPRTMAELSPVEKGRVSHRGHALRRIQPHLSRHFSLELAAPSPYQVSADPNPSSDNGA